jgi:hypothetical protein
MSRVALLLMLATAASPAAAQTTLGEALDAGATLLNVGDFEREIVTHLLVGKSLSGGDLEIVYGANGTVDGSGSPPRTAILMIQKVMISGRWTTDKDGRICTTLRFGQVTGGSSDTLPPRCQYWFKLGDAYFVSDYDTDRSAKVLRRDRKQPAPAGPSAPKTLGDLLDAGATKLSKQQVLDALNGATVSGARPDGGTFQALYKADGTYAGSFQGRPGAIGFGASGGLFGKWAVEDNGKFCTEHGLFLDTTVGQLPPGSASPGDRDSNCGFIFRMGDEFYACASESNRSAPVFKRVVKR